MEDQKPKKPLNAYFKHRKEFLEEDVKAYKECEFKERTERLNKSWQALD